MKKKIDGVVKKREEIYTKVLKVKKNQNRKPIFFILSDCEFCLLLLLI